MRQGFVSENLATASCGHVRQNVEKQSRDVCGYVRQNVGEQSRDVKAAEDAGMIEARKDFLRKALGITQKISLVLANVATPTFWRT